MLGGGHGALKRECVGWRAWAAELSPFLLFKLVYLFLAAPVFVAAGVFSSRGAWASRCGARPLGALASELQHSGSVAVLHGLGCSTACGIFLDRGSNPCPLCWQVGSYPLYHPGSPSSYRTFYERRSLELEPRTQHPESRNLPLPNSDQRNWKMVLGEGTLSSKPRTRPVGTWSADAGQAGRSCLRPQGSVGN